jgi:ATP-dependent DNA ligase
VKNLAELQAECAAHGMKVEIKGRESKEPYVAALRRFFWERDHPGEQLRSDVAPMLLATWEDFSPDETQGIENDHHAWAVQPKKDGIRVLFHIGTDGVRITGRNISEVTYRLTEHQENLGHLTLGWDSLEGSILDGELVCPASVINTGSSITASPLQAAVSILATSPEKAASIQAGEDAHLEFHVFDIIRCQGKDVTKVALYQRLTLLHRVLRQVTNRFVEVVPTGIVGKRSIHDRILASGGEGTVWKRLDGLYFPGRRVRHWVKRKGNVSVEAVVSGSKEGGNGHTSLIGSVQFSVVEADGSLRPIAWVSGWSDEERNEMTNRDSAGKVILNPSFLGRKAEIEGLDHSAKAGRIRHARIRRWLDQPVNKRSGEFEGVEPARKMVS